MQLVNLIEEDFVNYKEPGMFLGFCFCSGKCNEDAGRVVCQNYGLYHTGLVNISVEEIIERYKSNPITKCLILGGLEPFDSFYDLVELCSKWKEAFADPNYLYNTDNKIIIYTGYYPFEIVDRLHELAMVCGGIEVIIKFGRYIPGHKPHYDPVLGVNLASDNQYADHLQRMAYLYEGYDKTHYEVHYL